MQGAVWKMTEIEKDACCVARRLGLFYVGSKIHVRGKRVDHYRIKRGCHTIAQYWPSNQHLDVGGNRYTAAGLVEALIKVSEVAGLADAQTTLPSEPSRQRQPKRKTHRPKEQSHAAQGSRAAKATPAEYLTEDDWNLISMRLRQASANNDARNANIVSLYLELVERIEEARSEGARIILEPTRQKVN